MYNNHHSQLIGTGRLDVFSDRVRYSSFVTNKTTIAYNAKGLLWRRDFLHLSDAEKTAEIFKAYFEVEDKVFSTVAKLAESLSAFGIHSDPPQRLSLTFGTLDGIVYRIGQNIVLPNERTLPYMTDLKQALNILIQSIGEHPKVLYGHSTETLVSLYRTYLGIAWKRHGLNQPMHNTYTVTPDVDKSGMLLPMFIPKIADLLDVKDCPDLKSEAIGPLANFVGGLPSNFFNSQFVVFYAGRKSFYTFPKAIAPSEFSADTVVEDDLYDALDNLQYATFDGETGRYPEGKVIANYYRHIAQAVPDLIIVYEPTSGPNQSCIKWSVFNFSGE